MNKTSGIIVVVMWAIVLLAPAQAAWSESPVPGEVRSIGPGRVTLSMTPRGQWAALRTAWGDDESLISGGGIVVYAVGEDGRVREIANTGRGDMVAASPVLFRGAFEGAPGGLRAPAPKPDDDGDGKVDEDRLDGIDNDDDGSVDEDFSAIGDEMVVSAYRTPVGMAPALAFHQEAYAWSLPHIDGTIMLSLAISNMGISDLEGVRVAFYYSRDGSLEITRRNGDETWVASRDDAGTGLLLVPFTRPRSDGSWTDHIVEGIDASTGADLETLEGGGGDIARVDNGATIYCLSPPLGNLAPGQEIRVDVGIVAAPSRVDLAEAAHRALRTYAGDGQNRYLPPPVAIKPRVLWGYYHPLPGDEAGIWLDFDVADQIDISADDFAYFAGANEGIVESAQVAGGRSVLAIRGAAGQNILRSGERITLKGRLDSGEFFEANMRPYQREVPTELHQEAETFWATPGKLTQQLLTASPNPFRDATMIGYQIPSAIQQEDGSLLKFAGSYETTVKIYNVAGRLVSTLVDRVVGPGSYSVDWPAVDDGGNPVASGVYYLKLQIEKRFITKRLIVLK